MKTDLPSGTVTFLFTDIEGSTKQLQRLGERYASVLATQRKLLRAAFHKFHGREVDTQGDSFFVAFARAVDAINASVMAQRALAEQDWGEGERVRVRMGMHTGAPQLTAAGYVGLDVHIAARICAAAHGGQVLLSQQTHDLAEQLQLDEVSFRDLGEHRLKDLDRPRRLFQLVIANLPDEFPSLRTLDALPHNLPIQLTSFVGREKEIREIRGLLGRTRLLTLTGAGGAGKTRLSLQVAADLGESYAKGVWFIELAPLSDPALVAGTVAATLGVREQPGQPILDALIEYVRAQEMLLVLDNCEHLIDACAHLADALLRACPHVRVLATSREALGIAGETTWIVPSLSLPDAQQPRPTFADLSQYEAVQLFVARAVAVQPNFKLTELNAAAVAHVCQHLDGIPLAIELAAARVKVLQTAEIAARLDDRFRLLATGNRTALPRQQTLRGAIDWSYELLSEEERVLLRRLSVFAGGCTLEAAEWVIGSREQVAGSKQDSLPTTYYLLPATSILDLLSHLVDKSLVIVDQQGDETRYGMLETIREYAFEKLRQADEINLLRTRHLEFFLQFAQTAEPHFYHGGAVEWLDRTQRELDNVRAALAWSFESQDWERGLGVAAQLFEFWRHRAYWSEGRSWMTKFLELPGKARPSARAARAFADASFLAFIANDYVEAERLTDASFAILRTVQDRPAYAHALLMRGRIREVQDDLPAAMACYQESLQISTELKDDLEAAYALHGMGIVEAELGNFARGEELLASSLALSRQQQNHLWMVYTLMQLGNLSFEQQNWQQASIRFNETLELARAAKLKPGIAWMLQWLGTLAVYAGDYARAREMLTESIQLADAIGSRACIFSCLEEFAALAAAQGQYRRAARLLAASIALMETITMRRNDRERETQEQSIADIRRAMEQADFDRAWAEGRAMTQEQAIAYALEMPSTPEDATRPRMTRQAAKKEFNGLTEREREIAARIAQGESNREIADAFVVSERTVETHVTNILNKLGFTSRAEIRKWAVEKGLGKRE